MSFKKVPVLMDYSFKQKNRKGTLILLLHFHCKLLKFNSKVPPAEVSVPHTPDTKVDKLTTRSTSLKKN